MQLQENDQQQSSVMQWIMIHEAYCPKVDYFPITACLKVFLYHSNFCNALKCIKELHTFFFIHL